MTERKTQIMNAAISLFSVHGYEKTTVDMIAAEASVSKGTVYNYFFSKEEIFKILVKKSAADLKESIRMAVRERDPVKKLSDVIRIYFEFFRRNPQIYWIVQEYRLYFRNQGEKEISFYDQFFPDEEFLKLAEQDRKNGVLADVSLETVAYFVFGISGEFLYRELSGGKLVTEKEITEIEMLLLSGLSASGKTSG